MVKQTLENYHTSVSCIYYNDANGKLMIYVIYPNIFVIYTCIRRYLFQRITHAVTCDVLNTQI